jgi:chorismate--pyruvate lyase
MPTIGDGVFCREVMLSAWDTPCWYARTMIPSATYAADPVFFQRLNQESLGVLIFNEPRVRRVSLEHYPVYPSSPEYQWVTEWLTCLASCLWVRFSRLCIDQEYPFFLVEVLLPGLLKAYSEDEFSPVGISNP